MKLFHECKIKSVKFVLMFTYTIETAAQNNFKIGTIPHYVTA